MRFQLVQKGIPLHVPYCFQPNSRASSSQEAQQEPRGTHLLLYTPHISSLFIQLAVLAPLWGISMAHSFLWPLTKLLHSQSLSAFFPAFLQAVSIFTPSLYFLT